jgi:hypothetical protein
MIVYKLMRQRKDGSLGPLFINRRERILVGEWVRAEPHRTKGYAFRPGWHTLKLPFAPHLSINGRVWCKCVIENYTRHQRPVSQGGVWFLSEWMRVVEVLGSIANS